MKSDVYDVVKRQILQITSGPESGGRAALAKLRRGAGKPSGSLPDIWPYTIGALPEGASEYEEQAVHVALTLFALHRQGTEINGQNGGSLGSAVGRLRDGDNDGAITRRFNSAVTAATLTELSNHLRSLVQLLSSKKINMDYPRFAEELFYWQFESRREKVCLNWGRDYWRLSVEKGTEDQGDDSNEEA